MHGARVNGSTTTDQGNELLRDIFIERCKPELGTRLLSGPNGEFVYRQERPRHGDDRLSVNRNGERGKRSLYGFCRSSAQEIGLYMYNYSHPTIGARADVENVPIEHLYSSHHTYYQPDGNAVLVVAGKFDVKRRLRSSRRSLDRLRSQRVILQQTSTRPNPAQDGEREVVLHRVGQKQLVTAGISCAIGIAP